MSYQKFTDLLSKIGLDDIYKIANPAVLELINEFDKSPSKKSLALVISDIYHPHHFLEDKKKRNTLLQYLNESEAKEILELLGNYQEKENVWEQLGKTSFNKQKLKCLYDFFEFPVEESEDESDRKYLHSNSEKVKATYGLFYHQETAAAEVKSYLNKGQSRVLLHMPTGAGKTRTTMSVICDYIRNYSSRSSSDNNKLIVWLADTEELCEQAADEFTKAWSSLGVGETYLHRFYGHYDQDFTTLDKAGLLVAGMAKLNQRLSKSQPEILSLGRNSELLVFDEAHRVLAPTYKQLIEIFQSTGKAPLIGLSATPGRSTFDEEHNKNFAEFFQKNKVTLSIEGYNTPIDYLISEGYIAKANYHNLPYKPDDLVLTQDQIEHIASGKDIPKEVLEKLGVDTKRNLLIIEATLNEVEKGKQIIIFGCSVVNAEAIYALLKYKSILVGIVTSSTHSEIRKSTIRDYKNGTLNVIVNYGVLTTGFDAPKTNVAIIGRPTTSLTLYSQMIGRAARGTKAGGNSECDIYTVVDSTFPAFKSMAKAFSHWDDSWD